MLLVQAIFSPLSTENNCENFTISKIGLFFFFKQLHMKLWNSNIRNLADGQAKTLALMFELSFSA